MRALVPLLLLLPISAQAIPGIIQHQGRILDGSGLPVEGAMTLNIGLYSASTGGEPVWLGTPSVSLSDGYYSVSLGAAPQPALNLNLLTSGRA